MDNDRCDGDVFCYRTANNNYDIKEILEQFRIK